jgi:hypothetical protein
MIRLLIHTICQRLPLNILSEIKPPNGEPRMDVKKVMLVTVFASAVAVPFSRSSPLTNAGNP